MSLTNYKDHDGGVYAKEEGFQEMAMKGMALVLSSTLCNGNV
jgi:hypothetical protein